MKSGNLHEWLETIWSRLMPLAEESVGTTSWRSTHDSEFLGAFGLYAANLADAGPIHLRRLPSWSLPAVHPAFAFPVCRYPEQILGGPDANLWPDGVWSGRKFAAMLDRKRTHSWLFNDAPGQRARLAHRVQGAYPAVLEAERIVTSRWPGATVRSVIMTGSFLWSSESAVPDSMDVAVVADLPDGAQVPCFEHLQHERISNTTGRPRYIDLLAVDARLLNGQREASGTIGTWLLPDGSPFHYDTRGMTIVAAIRQTFRANLTVRGTDLFPAELESGDALVALAYYFVQEASQLLDYRFRTPKAVHRLHEAQIILDRFDELVGVNTARSMDVTGPLATLSWDADTPNPEQLASLQGWHGGPPAALPTILARLVRARCRLVDRPCTAPVVDPTQRAAIVAESIERALAHKWPGLSHLHGPGQDTQIDAAVVSRLGDLWSAHLLGHLV